MSKPTPRSFRVGMLRVCQETNARSPIPTAIEDFRHFVAGDALMEATGPGGIEAPGFLRRAELSGFRRAVRRFGEGRIEVVPLFSAWAPPGGPVSPSALAWLRQALAQALAQAGKLDGVFVSLHGAMGVEGGGEPESLLLRDLREAVGPDVPIAATVDLHAHLTSALLSPLTLLAAYRTNPHRDFARVGFRCGRMLIDTLFGRFTPTMAWRSLPMVTGGGTTLDFVPAMRPLFRAMSRLERDPKVRYVSLCCCQLWSDAPDLGWSVCVVTDADRALAEELADELADRAWSVRDHPPSLDGPIATIERARGAWWRRRFGTVCVCDASDVVGAGAPGDNTRLIAALLEHGRGMLSYAPIRDPAAVESLWDLPEGEAVVVTVGGAAGSPPLSVSGVVRRRTISREFGRVAVLDLAHVWLVVTTEAPLTLRPSFYRDAGLRPFRADICVVKSAFLFRLYFAWVNRLTLYVKTEGATDLDAAWRQTYDGPVHPKDEVADWRPADRRRRVRA